MAMTKAEASRMVELEMLLSLSRAMRWPSYATPSTMTKADIKANLVDGGVKYGSTQKVARGYFYSTGGFSREASVSYGCSDGVYHSREGDTTSAQNCGLIFALEIDAWRAARCELTIKFAKELAYVDDKISGLS